MGWLKKSIMSVSAAILTAAVIGVPAFADSLMTDADADICGEDECIGIYDGTYRSAGGEGADQMIRYYDHRGNYIGSALGSIDYFGEPFKVLPKGALLKTYDADGGIILRTEDFGEVCRLPADDDYDRIVSESRSYIGVTDCAEGSFTVTGRDGETAAVLDIKALRSAVNMCQADIYEAEGYLYIGISGSDLSDNNPSGGDLSTYAAMVFDDGSVLTSDDPEFPEILPGKVCGALGKYLIIDEREDPDSGHDYSVVTSDGEVQLSNVNISWKQDYTYGITGSGSEPEYVLIPEGETLRILDADLSEIGRVRDKDLNEYGGLQKSEGNIIGLSCEELGGAVCTTFLKYLRRDIPAAEVSGGYLVSEENGGFVPESPQGYEIGDISRQFILLYGDGTKQIIRRSDGDILLETDRPVILQDESFLVKADHYNYPGTKNTIYGKDGEILYESDRYIYAAPEGNYYITRGPWAGIADAHGNWLIRELQFDE